MEAEQPRLEPVSDVVAGVTSRGSSAYQCATTLGPTHWFSFQRLLGGRLKNGKLVLVVNFRSLICDEPSLLVMSGV